MKENLIGTKDEENKANILKIYPLSANPCQAVEAVEFGFDMFSGSYPKKISEKGQALMFSYELEDKNKNEEEDDDDTENNRKSAKRQRVEIVIDLNDKMFVFFNSKCILF